MFYKILYTLIVCCGLHVGSTVAQPKAVHSTVTQEQAAIIGISSQAAVGDLIKLGHALHQGLDAGMPINKLKELLIHMHAYTGFPRSIRGLQTLMSVVDERRLKGISDPMGLEASPIDEEHSKYDRGKAILELLTGVPENDVKTGYAAFAPTIEIFLKEHLFADLFERDVLSFVERELVTISVLASIGRVEPMLKSHLSICMHLGCTAAFLHQFVQLIRSAQGDAAAEQAHIVLVDLLTHK